MKITLECDYKELVALLNMEQREEKGLTKSDSNEVLKFINHANNGQGNFTVADGWTGRPPHQKMS